MKRIHWIEITDPQDPFCLPTKLLKRGWDKNHVYYNVLVTMRDLDCPEEYEVFSCQFHCKNNTFTNFEGAVLGLDSWKITAWSLLPSPFKRETT